MLEGEEASKGLRGDWQKWWAEPSARPETLSGSGFFGRDTGMRGLLLSSEGNLELLWGVEVSSSSELISSYSL